MVSRLVPLLAVSAIVAPGCGGSDANGSRADASRGADATRGADASRGTAASRGADATRGADAGQGADAGDHADPTGAHPPATAAGAAAARTNDAAEDPASFAESVRKRHARLWAVGDSAGGADASAVARLIRRNDPDKVLYLGDIYEGAAGFRAYRRLYGALPIARTPGNHDWPRFWTAKREWYSLTAAGWRVIELNSETNRHRDQLAYLKTLLRARGTCRLVFWHRPRFSAGPHGDDTSMQPYWRALEGHARLVVSGHDHNMQRFAPRNGLIQLVSGAGGYTHYRVDRSKPGLVFADSRHYGALRLTLARGHASLAFVSTSGRVLHTARTTCRP